MYLVYDYDHSSMAWKKEKTVYFLKTALLYVNFCFLTLVKSVLNKSLDKKMNAEKQVKNYLKARNLDCYSLFQLYYDR